MSGRRWGELECLFAMLRRGTDGARILVGSDRLKELEAREEMLKLLAKIVALDKARSYLRMFMLRRRFLRERAGVRGTIYSFTVSV